MNSDKLLPSCSCSESPEAHARAVLDRRTFLRRSLGGLLGLTFGGPLVGLLTDGSMSGLSAVYADAALRDAIALPGEPPVKSIIVLWMNGGPSQVDTFDPKPGHANGGPVKAIRSAVRGVGISEYLPQVASVLDRMAVIRCMNTREGNHARARELMHTGFTPNPTVAYPGLGSIVTFERGGADSPIPLNVSINSPGQKAGVLGMAYDPLQVTSRPGQVVQNLAPPRGIGDERFERRLQMLERQNEFFRERLGGTSHEADGQDAIMQGARRFMNAEQTKAFDFEGEPDSVRAAYGDTAFGRGCLLARRLVEAGVKFVEVTLNGWDTHRDNFTATQRLCGELDPPMATLVRDLEERGLLKSTLIIWMGEFGRTPRINGNEGRDHFARAWSVALAGAGVRPGTVIGTTSADGMEIVGNGVSTADLFRTILWLTGIDPDYEYYTPQGRPVKYADGGKLITGALRA